MTCNAKTLTQLLIQNKMPKTKLAAAAKISTATLTKIFHGKNVNVVTICKVANALNAKASDIVREPAHPGLNAAQIRISRGISREELAELSGVSVTTIEDFEQTPQNISAWTAYYLSAALGLTINEYMSMEVEVGNVSH